MYIARILYPIKVLGPGKRIGIWFDGCEHHCKGCSNPELWDKKSEYEINIDQIMYLIESILTNNKVDGFTITGGDPFFQPDDLYELLKNIHEISTDILVYTGYQYIELKKKYEHILKLISVLIDGKYVEQLNNYEMLKGSTNQSIIYLDGYYKDIYENYIRSQSERIQNFNTQSGTISVGIHKPGFNKELNDLLIRKGLINNE